MFFPRKLRAKQKHVSTPTLFPEFEKFRPRRNEISWKVLVAYYFITGIGLKSKRARISTPCLTSQTSLQRRASWADFLHPDTRQWYEGSGGLAQPSPPRCVRTEVPAVPASVAANLLSLDLLEWIRGAPRCPLLQKNKWVSHRSCWEWQEEWMVSSSAV